MKIQQLTPIQTRDITLAEGVREFTLHQRTSRHTAKTLRYYSYVLEKFGNWCATEGIETLAQVGPGQLRAFVLALEEGLSPTSVRTVLRGVRAFFAFLVREELLADDPFRKVKMPKAEKRILPAFTEAEVQKLLKATEGPQNANIRNRALLLLLLDSGLRLSECAALKVGDIDPATGVMVVMGKGRKERVAKLGGTALRAFNRYARLRGGEVGEALWLGKFGPMTGYGLAETIEKIGKATGVHAHPHKFRRTCALYMLRAGADVFSVQHLLGHADLGVLRQYLAQTSADVTKAHERFSPVDGLR